MSHNHEAVKNLQKPATEVMLMEIQDRYLATRSKKDYEDLFVNVITYAKSLTLKKLIGKVYLPEEEIDDISREASFKFMEGYLKSEKFKIDTSFAGLINLKILEAMFGPKKQKADKVGSINIKLSGTGSKALEGTELSDLPESQGFEYLWQPDKEEGYYDPMYLIVDRKEDAINSASSVITDIFDAEGLSLRDKLLLSLGVLNFISVKTASYEKFKKRYLTPSLDEALELTLLTMSNRLKDTD